MKRMERFFVLLAAALLLLTGCRKKAEDENNYTVYYANTEGTKLVESRYAPTAQTFEELMTELLGQMRQAPSSGEVSALKDGVSVNGYERGIDALRIDFSKEYYDLGNTDEVLLRAATVKTFSQVPGVTKVMITVDQEQLRDAEGQLVPAMDSDSFIDTKEGGINSYLYAKLSLYYPDVDGKKLVRETRSLHYSSNMVLERVIIEQLIAGPKLSGAKAVLTDAVKIQNIYIKDGVCTISFDEEVNKTPAESNATPAVALYSMVNSICETCDEITSVRFEIAGDDTVPFRGEISLEQEFSADYSYAEDGEAMPETEHSQTVAAETDLDRETETRAAEKQTDRTEGP